MAFKPSASRLELAQRCQYMYTGPHRWPKRDQSKFAQFGSAISSVGECAAIWGDAPRDAILAQYDLPETDLRRFDYAADNVVELLDRESDDQFRAVEVDISYDYASDTARLLTKRFDRDYADEGPTEIACKPDLVRIDADGRAHYRDWKTGQYARGKDPAKVPQMVVTALAVARWLGVDTIRAEIAQVDEGGVWLKSATLDAMDLDAASAMVRSIFASLEDPANRVPKPGRHCAASYCPIVGICEATKAAAAEVAKAARVELPASIETDEQAAAMLARLPAVDRMSEFLWDQLKSYAAKRPVEAGDGKLWGPVEVTRKSIKPTAEALEVLKQHLGDTVAETCVETRVSVTAAAIKRAAKAVAEPRKGAALSRDIIAHLESVDAVKESTFTQYKEVKA